MNITMFNQFPWSKRYCDMPVFNSRTITEWQKRAIASDRAEYAKRNLGHQVKLNKNYRGIKALNAMRSRHANDPKQSNTPSTAPTPTNATNSANTSNPPSGRRIPFTLIIGGTALAVIIGLIVKKIRSAIKGNDALKNKAMQNSTEQRYIEFVENQMRNGQYNEPAIVNSIKAQIVPIIERDITTKYNSGEISDQEYRDAKAKIENVKKANTLEEIYNEIKNPEVKREIIAYRTARSKIERELSMLQRYAMQNQMSPFHDAGVKGMKKGQHVKARDPEYLKRLKTGLGLMGGGAALMGAGILMRRKAGKLAQAASGAAKSIGGAAKNVSNTTKSAANTAQNAANTVKNVANTVQRATSAISNTANTATKAVAKTNMGNTLARGNKLVKRGSLNRGHAIKAKSIKKAGVVPNISSKNVLNSTSATQRALRTKGYSWSV